MESRERWMETGCAYYSRWLGKEDILNRAARGTEYIYSKERNEVQPGYGSRFDIYMLCQKGHNVISYGDRTAKQMDVVKAAVAEGMEPEEIDAVIERIYGRKTNHNIKYVLGKAPEVSPFARLLVEEDYREYEDFWRKCNPGCRDTEWLKEYFDEIINEHMCAGVYADDMLVSCTDAPCMPYMEDMVQEIGINTLEQYRGKGYASMACGRCISELITRHKVPLWSASADNFASRRLAEKTGFVEFADVFTMTL